MTSIALYKTQNILVEIVDEPFKQGGATLVPVKALHGQPFADGAKSTTKTAYRTVNAKSLVPFTPDSSILQRALAFTNKKQWHAGESIWLHSRAFLAESNGFITLHLVGKPDYCKVFWMNPESGWQPCRNLESNYLSWAQAVQK
jgi:hypothetical protein